LEAVLEMTMLVFVVCLPGNRLGACGRFQSSGVSGMVRGLCRSPNPQDPLPISLAEGSRNDVVERGRRPPRGPNPFPKCNLAPVISLGIMPLQIWGVLWGLRVFKAKLSCPPTYLGFERQIQCGPRLPTKGNWGRGGCSLFA
jgi:hypothetical protein